ncbi:MAG: hypothetical protein ABIN67_16025 [Ferruginibacter sp.]
MTPDFKRHFATFLLFHLVFAVILLTGYKIFTGLTMEILSYLFWFIIIFGLIATLIQSITFTIISSKLRLNKPLFFAVAFIVELILVNTFIVYANGGDSFTGDLINDIKYHNTWENLSGSLIIHVALFLATLIISLTRPIYKKVAAPCIN